MEMYTRLLEAEMWKNKCRLCCLKCEEWLAFTVFIFKPVWGSGGLFSLVWSVFSLIRSLKLELHVFCYRRSMQGGKLM